MPQVGRIEISIMEEDQSRWLAFKNGELDIMNMEGPMAPNAIVDGKIRPELAAKGIRLDRIIDPEIRYIYWNMLDPALGGFSKEKIALRRALAMSYDVAEEIKRRAQRPGGARRISDSAGDGRPRPELEEHDQVRSGGRQRVARPVRLQARRRTAGARWPDGKPMVIRYASRPDTLGRQQEEMVKKSFDAIGVRMEGQKDKFPELLKLEKQCKLSSRTAAWIADYPDGDNFMQLFYGPNAYQSNNGCVDDAGIRRAVPEDDQNAAGIRSATSSIQEMARIMEAYAPHVLTISRYRNQLVQPRVEGYRKHPILPSAWQYLDVAPSLN